MTRLALRGKVAASTQNQAFNALVFFYKEVLRRPLQGVDALRAKRPAHLRHAPTVSETRALLLNVRNFGAYPTRLITRLLYGCGLRVSEPLNLRIKDVDLERAVLFIRGAKGGKDRLVSLPHSLIQEMQQQRTYARAVWQSDQERRIPVELPMGFFLMGPIGPMGPMERQRQLRPTKMERIFGVTNRIVISVASHSLEKKNVGIIRFLLHTEQCEKNKNIPTCP